MLAFALHISVLLCWDITIYNCYIFFLDWSFDHYVVSFFVSFHSFYFSLFYVIWVLVLLFAFFWSPFAWNTFFQPFTFSMYVLCVYVYMCIYIYIYIYIHTHTHTHTYMYRQILVAGWGYNGVCSLEIWGTQRNLTSFKAEMVWGEQTRLEKVWDSKWWQSELVTYWIPYWE